MPRPSPLLFRRRMGGELRRLREELGLNADTVADELGWHKAKVSRIETAKVAISRHDLYRMCELYSVDADTRAALDALVPESRERTWWASYSDVIRGVYTDFISLENEASDVTEYHPLLIPGLLQTHGYAVAVNSTGPFIADPDDSEALAEVRVRRQRLLRDDEPLRFRGVTTEAALRMVVGGREVLALQLEHLLEVTEDDHVVFQVLPFETPAGGFGGGVTLLEFANSDDPGVVFLESQGGMALRDGDRDVRRYRRLLEHLMAHALSPEETRELIRKRMEELA